MSNDGENWISKGNWLGTIDHCSWAGVTCSASQKVKELTLQNNQLSGFFPSDLINLANLATLNFSLNSLEGIIPEDLCFRSTSNSLIIYGDVANCQDSFPDGCCDFIYGLTAVPSLYPSVSPTTSLTVPISPSPSVRVF